MKVIFKTRNAADLILSVVTMILYINEAFSSSESSACVAV